MATLRKICRVVTRSFYRQHRRKQNAISSQLLTPSSTLLHHHYKQYSMNGAMHSPSLSTSASKSKSSPIISHSRPFQWSTTGKLICLFSVTTVSYLAYKRLFGAAQETEPIQPSSSPNALLQSAVKLFEHKLGEYNLSFRMALYFDTRKHYDRALYFYKLFLRKPETKKGEYAALNNMVVIYYRRNEFENALIALQLLGNAQIQERNLEFVRAHCHHSLKQFDDALTFYKLFIRNPRSKPADLTAAYNNVALLCYELGRYEEAAQYFQLIGDDKIVDKNYAFRVAHSLQNINEFERSLKYYNLYLAHSDDVNRLNLQNTYHNLGVLFYDHGKDEEALQMLQKLSGAEIELRNLEFKMAHLCAKMGDKATAIDYLRLCTRKPKVYKEYALICQGILAQLLYETQQYTQACAEFDALGEAETAKQDLFFAAAYSYAQCDEYAKALRLYALLLQHKSEKLSSEEEQYIWSRIAVLQYRVHEYASALQTLKEHLHSQYIAQWNLEFMAAHCHQKLGAYPEAITHYQQFLANKESEAGDVQKCYQNLALLYFDLRQFAKCIEYFACIEDEAISRLQLDFYVARSYHELAAYNANYVELAMKYYQRYLRQQQQLSGLDEELDAQHQANVVDAYSRLGLIYVEQQQWRKALAMFAHLSEEQILSLGLADAMSQCYAAIGDAESEHKYRSVAATQLAQESEQQISVAKLYYNMHQNRLAADLLLPLGEHAIVEHELEFVMAHCLQLVGDNEGAIRYYLLGLSNAAPASDEEEEGVVNAWHNIGCAYHDVADYEHAAHYFGKLSVEHIQRTNTEFIVAVCYHHLKRYRDALRYYQLFLDNYSDGDTQTVKSCHNNMIICYFYGLQDLENAYEYLRRMTEEEIIERKFLYEMARCAQQSHDRERSMKYYQLFLRHNQEALNDEIVDNVYQNVHSLCVEDQQFMPQIQKIKESGNGDKHKELQLFVAWMNQTDCK